MEQSPAAGPSYRGITATLGTGLLIYALAHVAGLTAPPAHQPEEAPTVISHGWAVAPFALLLGCIAILPLLGSTSHWWENNRNKFIVASALAALTLLYLAFLHP